MSELISAGMKDGLFRAILRIAVYGLAAFWMLASDVNHGFDEGFTFSRSNGYSFAQFILFVAMFELSLLVTFIRQKTLYLTILVGMTIAGIWLLREATLIEVKKKNCDAIACEVRH